TLHGALKAGILTDAITPDGKTSWAVTDRPTDRTTRVKSYNVELGQPTNLRALAAKYDVTGPALPPAPLRAPLAPPASLARPPQTQGRHMLFQPAPPGLQRYPAGTPP